ALADHVATHDLGLRRLLTKGSLLCHLETTQLRVPRPIHLRWIDLDAHLAHRLVAIGCIVGAAYVATIRLTLLVVIERPLDGRPNLTVEQASLRARIRLSLSQLSSILSLGCGSLLSRRLRGL